MCLVADFRDGVLLPAHTSPKGVISFISPHYRRRSLDSFRLRTFTEMVVTKQHTLCKPLKVAELDDIYKH